MKFFLRVSGVDKFPDTKLIIVVHEASYQGTMAATRVRLTAGDHQAMTDEDMRGRFQHPIAMMVEQGTCKVFVDLTDAAGTSVLASLALDMMTDIGIKNNPGFREMVFEMKPKNKAVSNPRIRLTVREDTVGDEEAMFGNIALTSWENQVMFQETVAKNIAEDTALSTQIHLQTEAIHKSSRPTWQEQMSEVTLLGASLRGPLELHGPWDRKRVCYVAIMGPPERKKHCIGIWQDARAYEDRRKPQEEIDLLKILSVQPDPAKLEVFFIIYQPKKSEKRRLAFERVDRSRDLWVECLSAIIDKVHLLKDMRDIQMGRTVSAMVGHHGRPGAPLHGAASSGLHGLALALERIGLDSEATSMVSSHPPMGSITSSFR